MSEKQLFNSDSISPSDIYAIVEILEGNGVILAPVETVYGLITKAFRHQPFKRLDEIKGARTAPYSVLFNSVEQVEMWVGALSQAQRGVIYELSSKGATFILGVGLDFPAGFRYQSHGMGVRIRPESVLSEVSRLLSEPLWATSANRSGRPAPGAFDQIETEIFDSVDAVIETKSLRWGIASTVTNLQSKPFKVIRKGPNQELVDKTLSTWNRVYTVLVVCTGNICRSPIAALALAEELRVLQTPDYLVDSAGTCGLPAYPATDKMVEIAGEWGIDLTRHSSKELSENLVAGADLILVMTEIHRADIERRYSHLAPNIGLLGEPIGLQSISDPYQLSKAQYLACSELILQSVKAWAKLIHAQISDQTEPGESHDRVEA